MARNKFLLALATLAVIFVGGLVFSHTASALSDTYFDTVGPTCDVSPCSADEQTAVAEGSHAPKSEVNLSAYYNSADGTLVVHNANFCPSESNNRDAIGVGNYIDTHPGALKTGDHIVKIVVTPLGGTPMTQYGDYYANPVAACDADLTFPLTNMSPDPGSQKYKATIVATPVDNFPGTCTGAGDGDPSLPGNAFCDGYTNYFNFQETSNGYAIAQNNDDTGQGYKVTMRTGNYSVDYATLSIKFGADCSVTKPTTARLTYYDMDNDGSSNAQPDKNRLIQMYLLDSKGNKVNTSYGTTWTPTSGHNTTDSASFTAQPGEKYTWVLKDVYRGNLIQIGTPYDGIYALTDCKGTTLPQPTQPYFSVTGGDVAAGASFATGTGASVTVPCSAAPHVTTAGITSWNNESGTFAGAGSEYATYALGVIQDFATGQGTGQSGPGGPATGLTFSNVNTSGSVNPSAGRFGGLFGSAPCVDYWETKPDLSTLQNISGSPISLGGMDGAYTYTGNLTINGGTIPPGKHVTIYVQGDVSLSSDVKYSNANWSNRQEIPSLRLIVHGSIYIDANVKELNGLYAAIPDPGVVTKSNTYSTPIAGTISTCSFGFNSYNPPNDGAGQPIYSQCGNPLTINGSVAAQQLWLLRASSVATPGIPASPIETINYTPETWLSIDPSVEVAPDLSYQSIIGLPPVL